MIIPEPTFRPCRFPSSSCSSVCPCSLFPMNSATSYEFLDSRKSEISELLVNGQDKASYLVWIRTKLINHAKANKGKIVTLQKPPPVEGQSQPFEGFDRKVEDWATVSVLWGLAPLSILSRPSLPICFPVCYTKTFYPYLFDRKSGHAQVVPSFEWKGIDYSPQG